MQYQISVPYTKVVLEKLQISCLMEVSEHLLDARVEIVDTMARSLAVEARGYVWAEKESVCHQEVKYPSDWWQAWKERFRFRLPKWFVIKYPVEYTVVVLDVRAIYPTLKQQLPGHQAVLIIQRS